MKDLKILMLSWEYPPKMTGGLGTACEGIATTLAQAGHRVEVLLPRTPRAIKTTPNLTITSASSVALDEGIHTEGKFDEHLRDLEFGSRFLPYLPAEVFTFTSEKPKSLAVRHQKKRLAKLATDEVELSGEYTDNILNELHKYALIAAQIVRKGSYDVVHAHDWVTFKAGQLIEKTTHTPVFFHVHSIESDRNGHAANKEIMAIEQAALAGSQYIVCVSSRLARAVAERYGVERNRLEVVPNGISSPLHPPKKATSAKKVGFVGRLTYQKGPGHFLDIAHELRARIENISFEMVGDGFLLPNLKKKSAQLNLDKQLSYLGFITPSRIKEVVRQMDILIAPSASEPFGFAILEAIHFGVPVITSLNTGIAEFVPSVPMVPDWDIFQCSALAEKLLTDEQARQDVVAACQKEAKSLTWKASVEQLEWLYRGVIERRP